MTQQIIILKTIDDMQYKNESMLYIFKDKTINHFESDERKRSIRLDTTGLRKCYTWNWSENCFWSYCQVWEE